MRFRIKPLSGLYMITYNIPIHPEIICVIRINPGRAEPGHVLLLKTV